MSRSLENLSINPLFFDALSGEFRPKGDPEQALSLGRLAVATFQKGELVIPPMKTRQKGVTYALRYQPSWAPDIAVSVLVDELDDFPEVSVVSINRKAPGYGGVSFIKTAFDSGPLYLKVGQKSRSEQFSTIWPLELGPPINEVRSAVTEAAQEFFSK
jgi:hypothetical protein